MASVKPKKHLGQHFLTDQDIALKIVGALTTSKGNLIEIGPGTGVLTRHLLDKKGLDFLAFDVDGESVAYLRRTYPGHKSKFRLGDFLTYRITSEQASLIGNFPYNISSQLFFKIWEDREKVDEVVCMVQKEVADRICSKHASKVYGILSVLLQACYQVEYLFTVPPGVFHPPPKVQSAVIRMKRREQSKIDCDPVLFKRVVKAGFGKRRKTLRNSLKDINLPEFLTGDPILNLRAEQLTVEDFVSLTKKILSNGCSDAI